jgi:hypothetical protein
MTRLISRVRLELVPGELHSKMTKNVLESRFSPQKRQTADLPGTLSDHSI